MIAEGLDQAREWLYALLVLATALCDNQGFQNLIVNGLVQAADGKKMSNKELPRSSCCEDPVHVCCYPKNDRFVHQEM